MKSVLFQKRANLIIKHEIRALVLRVGKLVLAAYLYLKLFDYFIQACRLKLIIFDNKYMVM